jgi:hypothetical protein
MASMLRGTHAEPVKRVACALIAACAASCIATATASAIPAFYECAKVSGGRFSRGCKAEGGRGGHELQPGVGKGKEYKGKGGPLNGDSLTIKGEKRLSCLKFTFTGKPEGTSEIRHFVITATGCRVEGAVATTPGQPFGEIVSNPLEGELGYLDAGHTKAALRLHAESGEVFEMVETTFEGFPVTGAVEGSLYGEVATVNQLTKTFQFTVKAINAVREISGFEGAENATEFAFETEYGRFPTALEATFSVKGEDLDVKL